MLQLFQVDTIFSLKAQSFDAWIREFEKRKNLLFKAVHRGNMRSKAVIDDTMRLIAAEDGPKWFIAVTYGPRLFIVVKDS